MTNDESQGAAALNGAMDVGVNCIAVMKSVGLNVAADTINIINYSDKYGLSGKKGGAVVVCGDDPHASSTQVAGDSRALMEHLKMPIIEPSNPQEIKDWIGEALRLSTYSNLVVGYLITPYLAEGGGNVQIYENKSPEISFKHPITIDISKVDIKRKVSIPPNTWDLEKEIIRDRFPRVHEYVRQNHLNKILYSNGKKHNIGFVAAGISYSYLEQALWELGCDEQFPILNLSVTFPLDPAAVEEFSKLADNIVVVEEKGPIIEDQIKTILTDLVQDGKIKKEPGIWGKILPKDKDGFPEESGLTPSMVIEKLGNLILELGDSSANYDEKKIHSELDLLAEIKAYGVLVPPRSPGFCAGCPHRETLSAVHSMRDQPEHKDIFAHGDIGCYSMSFLPPFGEMHNLTAMSLGGAAGAGMDPFVTNKQYAMMGDSTFFWRGMTAISNSIKEGQDILYLILDNKNTGCPGLTIVNTDYGEKIGIDQSICVSDTYCTKVMACPSFEKVIVTRNRPPRSRVKKISFENIPQPTPHRFTDTWKIFISGVGGMGVGVMSSVLARAGTKEGYHVRFNDKKGLAIRNGAVSAHVLYSNGRAKISTIVPNGKADLLMGVDMLEAERSLVYASQVHTTAVVNTTVVPTIPMLAGMMNYPPDAEENIRKHTNSDEYFGGRLSEISELYFGSKLFTNMILLGAAFQKGLIPVSEQNLIDAIMETVPPSQRTRNMEALRLGRKMAIEPELLEFKNIVADGRILTLFGAKESYQSVLDMKAKQLSHSYWMFWRGKTVADEYRRLVESTVATMRLDEDTNRAIARRIYDLIMWGELPYAEKYVDRVLEVFRNDREDKDYAATKTAILDLHKVMAIKDEIYTPHLLTDSEKLDRNKIRYNIDEENGDRITYEHIHRPEV